jgi:hypothetical protein
MNRNVFSLFLIIILTVGIISCDKDTDNDIDNDIDTGNDSPTIINNIDISLIPDLISYYSSSNPRFDLIINNDGKFSGLHMYSSPPTNSMFFPHLSMSILQHLINNQWSEYHNSIKISLLGKTVSYGTRIYIEFNNIVNTSNIFEPNKDFQHEINRFLTEKTGLEYIILSLHNESIITNELIIYDFQVTYNLLINGSISTYSWSLANEFQKAINNGIYK